MTKFLKYLNDRSFYSTPDNEDKQGTKARRKKRREMQKRAEDMDKDGGRGKNRRPKGHSE